MNWLAPSVFSYVDVVGSVSGSRLAPILPRGIEREPRGEAGVEGRGTPRRPDPPQDRAISMEGDHDVCIDQKSRAGRAVVGLGGRRRVEEEEEEGQMRRVGGGGGWEVFGAMLGFRKDLRKQRRRRWWWEDTICEYASAAATKKKTTAAMALFITDWKDYFLMIMVVVIGGLKGIQAA